MIWFFGVQKKFRENNTIGWAPKEEQNGANFSSVAPSSEELRARKEQLSPVGGDLDGVYDSVVR